MFHDASPPGLLPGRQGERCPGRPAKLPQGVTYRGRPGNCGCTCRGRCTAAVTCRGAAPPASCRPGRNGVSHLSAFWTRPACGARSHPPCRVRSTCGRRSPRHRPARSGRALRDRAAPLARLGPAAPAGWRTGRVGPRCRPRREARAGRARVGRPPPGRGSVSGVPLPRPRPQAARPRPPPVAGRHTS